MLATAPDDYRLSRVSFALVATLGVYWIAETYVHWIATRTIHGRDLTGPERMRIIKDGWPLMAASIVPVVVLLAEALLQIETATAVKVMLVVISSPAPSLPEHGMWNVVSVGTAPAVGRLSW